MAKNSLENVLITGSGGMVGSYIDFGIRTDRRSLDVTDLTETMRVVRFHKPKTILHLAAETDVDRCEREPLYAYQVNAIGTYNIVLAAEDVGAKLVYISTLGVFDGKKSKPYKTTDRPNPMNYYGHSKFLGEVVVREKLKNYLIVRGGWMFGGGPRKDQKFVAKIIRQFSNKEILGLTDAMGSPTFGKDLVAALKRLIQDDKQGIFHVTNKGICSRYDVASAIVRIMDKKIKMVPVDSRVDHFGLNVTRSLNETTVPSIAMRSWESALEEYLETEWSSFK